MSVIVRAIEEHKLFRRMTLAWACWLISVVVLRATEPGTLTQITAAGATVVSAVIGILTTVIAFYQKHRAEEEN